jgi:hypothetical protein
MPSPSATAAPSNRQGRFRPANLSYPKGGFAFTIFDDTDVATVGSVRPVYDLLTELGLRTTKTVWPLPFEGPSNYAGSHTLADAPYADYVRELAARGFEVAYHGARQESSSREVQKAALARFREIIGAPPRSFASHAQNRDNLFWGEHRFGSLAGRLAYRAMSREDPAHYGGHREGSPWFWGDLARTTFAYVRGFTFSGIDLWDATPYACYEDPRTDCVTSWFSSNDADNVEEFVALCDDAALDRLEAQGGLCIISTHLGKGFVRDGRVDPRIVRILRRVAARDGWFVPVSTLLDHLVASGCRRRLGITDRWRLEASWFADTRARHAQRRTYEPTEVAYLTGEQR